MMGVRKMQAGDTVFVRATALEVWSDVAQIRIEDHPSLAVTLWVPASEVTRAEDFADMRPPRRRAAEAC
jgi:hypothetical protein